MEVQTACGEVRAGQTLPAQTRAVRAAADGDDARRNICGTHGGLRVFNKVHVGENFFLHIIVAVAHRQLKAARAPDGVEIIRRPAQKVLARLELLPVVVAHDQLHARKALIALHRADVVKALIALRVGGRLRRWQE